MLRSDVAMNIRSQLAAVGFNQGYVYTITLVPGEQGPRGYPVHDPSQERPVASMPQLVQAAQPGDAVRVVARGRTGREHPRSPFEFIVGDRP